MNRLDVRTLAVFSTARVRPQVTQPFDFALYNRRTWVGAPSSRSLRGWERCQSYLDLYPPFANCAKSGAPTFVVELASLKASHPSFNFVSH
jgi:hypothetical protein